MDAPVLIPTVAPLATQKRYFLRSGDSRSPVVNGLTIVWIPMGDGYSYYIPRDPVIADALHLTYASKQKGGVQEVTADNFYELKKNSEQRQKAIDSRKKLEEPFRDPGLHNSSRPAGALDHPLISPLHTPVPPAVAAAVGDSTGTIIRDMPVRMTMFETPKVVAEPLPPDPDLTDFNP